MTRSVKAIKPTAVGYLSQMESAIYLSIGLTSLKKLADANEFRSIPVFGSSREIRHKVTELDAYMERQARKAS